MRFSFLFHIFLSYFGRVLAQSSLENSGKKFSTMHVSKSPVKTPWPLLAPSYETYELLEVLACSRRGAKSVGEKFTKKKNKRGETI